MLDGAAEQRLVARGGDLQVGRQARGVDVDRVRHAERDRLAGHQPPEVLLGAAERLGDHRGGVVGRPGDERLERVLDRERLAGLEAELGRRPRGGARRDRQRRIELEMSGLDLLEQHVERHHLGDRGRVTRRVRVRLMQHLAGLVVDHDRRVVRPVPAGDARAGLADRADRFFPLAASCPSEASAWFFLAGRACAPSNVTGAISSEASRPTAANRRQTETWRSETCPKAIRPKRIEMLLLAGPGAKMPMPLLNPEIGAVGCDPRATVDGRNSAATDQRRPGRSAPRSGRSASARMQPAAIARHRNRGREHIAEGGGIDARRAPRRTPRAPARPPARWRRSR